MFFSKLYQSLRELKKLILLCVTLPVEPTDLVVLTISVIVAVLCPTALISAAEHRHTLGKKQSRKKIPALPIAQGADLRIVARSFHAAVPRLIIVVAVAVTVAVQLVMFFIVTNKISQRKSVMRYDEVDTGTRPPAVVFIEIRTSGEAVRHLAHAAFVAFPKTAHRIAIFPVPFRPEHGKVADLITALAHIPWFCN